MLGNTASSLDIGDLPIVPGDMRATAIFQRMRNVIRTTSLKRLMFWKITPGSGWELAYRLLAANKLTFLLQISLAATGAGLYYGPPFFLRKLVAYLEEDPDRQDRSWGWAYSLGLFGSTALIHIGMVLLVLTWFRAYPSRSYRTTLVGLNYELAGSLPDTAQQYSVCEDSCSQGCRVLRSSC